MKPEDEESPYDRGYRDGWERVFEVLLPLCVVVGIAGLAARSYLIGGMAAVGLIAVLIGRRYPMR